MQIVIPMSGFGERFRRAGYSIPKPLIEVDGKPIIEHVVEMFPGAEKFIFICNEDHLFEPEYRMKEILRRCAPQSEIVAIAPHKLGPVNAVIQAAHLIDPERPTIVNYCDFTCYWDFAEFRTFVEASECDGAIPAYKGFHPHSLGSTFYAYVREQGLWACDIQEKRPFTDRPMEEFASSGTYYFRSGALCLEALRRQIDRDDLKVNDEYYVSLAYKILFEDQRRIAVYPLQHFMQWGTPADLEEYQGWSRAFRHLVTGNRARASHTGAVLIPMAGLGKRFAEAGYEKPKPLIEVSGRPMVIQATRDLPDAPVHRFVLRKDLPFIDMIAGKLKTSFACAEMKVLGRLTEGQAITCLQGLEGLDLDEPLTIGACDNGVLYDAATLNTLLDDSSIDVLVWVVRGHADGKARPHMFGWVDADENGVVKAVSVKAPLADPANDPMIVGSFTFKRASQFQRSAERLVRRDARVNGEFYVDSLIEDAIALGLNVRLFEVDAYIGWGTPDDLNTFEYWQSCFHKWKSHPYRLEKDRRVPAAKVETLDARYAHQTPELPAGIGAAALRKGSDRGALFGEVSRFLPVGVLAVAIDFCVYTAFLTLGAAASPAKAIGFVAGAIFAYLANERFTFRKRAHRLLGPAAFIGVYGTSLALNVSVNAAALRLLEDGVWLERLAAFALATAVSAATNFAGMKWFVFRGRTIAKANRSRANSA